MLVRGCGSRETYILYSHLLSQSKDLAMGVYNGDERYNFDKIILYACFTIYSRGAWKLVIHVPES